MAAKILIISLSIFSLLIIGCKGPKGDAGPTGPAGNPGEDGTDDKQIRITFPSGFQTYNTTWDTLGTAYALFSFNVSNYAGVDSVVFSIITGMNNENDTCFVQLLNITDIIPINSSFIRTTNFEDVRIFSGNIFDELPNKEIDLTILVKGSLGSTNMVFAESPYLILYRK